MNTSTILSMYPGKRTEIPYYPRTNLPELFKALGYIVGAEIGVANGGFTTKFLDAGLRMYAVDPFIDTFRNRAMNKTMESTAKLFSKYGTAKLIAKKSMDAVNDFEDNSLDFVYIDANHTLRYIVEDLVEWSKKVKSGGIISGHDYWHKKVGHPTLAIEVDAAVNMYTELYGIQNWWIFGKIPESKDANDRCHSFMWFKP